MTGIELRTSCIGSDHSTNWATTIALSIFSHLVPFSPLFLQLILGSFLLLHQLWLFLSFFSPVLISFHITKLRFCPYLLSGTERVCVCVCVRERERERERGREREREREGERESNTKQIQQSASQCLSMQSVINDVHDYCHLALTYLSKIGLAAAAAAHDW